MKKYKKILFLILIIIGFIIIYNSVHYSKKEILDIINRTNETFDNIYINTNRDEKYIYEIYAKDNVIYTHTYENKNDEIIEYYSEIWDLKTKKKTGISYDTKTIRTSNIRGKRISKSSYRSI